MAIFANRRVKNLSLSNFMVSVDVFPKADSSVFAFEEEIPDGWK